MQNNRSCPSWQVPTKDGFPLAIPAQDAVALSPGMRLVPERFLMILWLTTSIGNCPTPVNHWPRLLISLESSDSDFNLRGIASALIIAIRSRYWSSKSIMINSCIHKVSSVSFRIISAIFYRSRYSEIFQSSPLVNSLPSSTNASTGSLEPIRKNCTNSDIDDIPISSRLILTTWKPWE